MRGNRANCYDYGECGVLMCHATFLRLTEAGLVKVPFIHLFRILHEYVQPERHY